MVYPLQYLLRAELFLTNIEKILFHLRPGQPHQVYPWRLLTFRLRAGKSSHDGKPGIVCLALAELAGGEEIGDFARGGFRRVGAVYSIGING